MQFSRVMLAAVMTAAVAQPQTSLTSCRQVDDRLNEFLKAYNPFGEGPKANLTTIASQFGPPARIEPGAASATSRVVYEIDGCLAEFLLDRKGIVWMTRAKAIPFVPTPAAAALEQLASVEKSIQEVRQQLEGLEALKASLLKQVSSGEAVTAALQPSTTATAPSAADADALYLANDYAAAVRAYSQVITSDPGNAKAVLRRAFCYQKLGSTQAALEDYSTAIRLLPDEPLAYQNRAAAYFALGDPAKALADLDRVRQIERSATQTGTQATTAVPALPSLTDPPVSSGGSAGRVQVRGYYRRDGTYVQPHTRSYPRRR